jgi:hypothetical protein
MAPNPRSGWRRHLTYSNVMSTLAVFLVLAGGTALAAGLRRNSVNSRTVKDNSLLSADLKDGAAITGADVADGSLDGSDVAGGSLKGADIGDGSISGADVADGSLGGAKLAKGAIGAANIAPKAVNSANIVDGSITGADIGVGTVTGKNIDESTLSQVPEAVRLEGLPAAAFVRNFIYENRSQLQTGIEIGDGTFKISQACLPGDLLLSANVVEVDSGSTLIESFPKDGTWTARINPHGTSDSFRVNAICALQAGLPTG